MNTVTTANPNPALVPDRETPYRVRGVYELVVDGGREELIIVFDGACLAFRADPDTDTLESRFAGFEFEPSADHRPLAGTPLDRAIGAEFGWSWLAWNQQGYCDSALLSFAGITPSVLIHVIGSSVKVFGIDATAA